MQGIIRSVKGRKARFCGVMCAEGFRSDRDGGVVYPAVLSDATFVSHEQASMVCGCCAYCNANLKEDTAYVSQDA